MVTFEGPRIDRPKYNMEGRAPIFKCNVKKSSILNVRHFMNLEFTNKSKPFTYVSRRGMELVLCLVTRVRSLKGVRRRVS